jgi:hypothetical protein
VTSARCCFGLVRPSLRVGNNPGSIGSGNELLMHLVWKLELRHDTALYLADSDSIVDPVRWFGCCEVEFRTVVGVSYGGTRSSRGWLEESGVGFEEPGRHISKHLMMKQFSISLK